MNLIIKPTGRCNFACKFCSANGLQIQHPENNKVPDQIKEFILKLKPKVIIITGGEPLTVAPEYYYDMHHLVPDATISATTNLKDFYYNPEKWAPLFKEKWFGVGTSFNYGDSRMWDVNTVYTEEMFRSVMDKWIQYVSDNVPGFIAVIDESNEDRILDHVYLAKEYNTQAKINNAIGVGRQGKTYPRYKIFQAYLDIIDKGLDQWEYYCSTRQSMECPRNIQHFCNTSIRCCYIGCDDKLHVGICDEQVSMGHELPEDLQVPKSIYPEYNILKPEECITDKCMYCELYSLCNGCNTNRQEAKKDPNYCGEMKKLEKRIIETGWAL
jgi:MoaA/NifB/PqqE/SkfB family radical SAM enzyme